MMNVRALLFLLAGSLAAASSPITPADRAQAEFNRLAASPAPSLAEASQCIQDQAGLAPLADAEALPMVEFRKGWCGLAVASISGEAAAFRSAAADFERASQAWPARAEAQVRRKQPAEALPAVLPILAQIARLRADTGEAARKQAWTTLTSALAAPACPAGFLPPAWCRPIFALGREWEGWLELEQSDPAAAAVAFAAAGAPEWTAWVNGLEAFRAGRFAEAANAYAQAVAAWTAARAESPRPLLGRISPPVDLSNAYTELGGARLLAGEDAGAIAALDRAVRESPENSRALFLRARAEDAAGRTQAAEADYNLASRTAFANAAGLASGEAHLYRGVLLFRRRQYSAAEDEFSSALNFSISASLRADAVAWRRLSAVAEGSCDAGLRYFEQALPAASPYFPRHQAESFVAACRGL